MTLEYAIEDAAAPGGLRLAVVGPASLSGPAGSRVRGRWGLATNQMNDTLQVVWRAGGDVLQAIGWIARLEFDLDGCAPGEVIERSVQAVVYGPDWRVELPECRVQIEVTA